MTDLAKLVVTLEAQTARYQADLEKARKQLDRFDKTAKQVATQSARAIAAAAVAAAAGLSALTKSAIDNQDRLSKMSEQTGVTTEALSQLEYAASLADVSSEALGVSLKSLAKNSVAAAKGSDAQADAFKKLGVSVQNADGSMKSMDALVLEVADSFAGLADGTGKAALAQAIFGKQGMRMIPLLNAGSAGIKSMMKEADQFGLTVDGKAAKSAELFNDNIERLEAAGRGWVNQATTEMLPVLAAFTEQAVSAAKETGVMDRGARALANGLKLLITSGVLVKSVFESLGTVIGGVAAGIVAVAHGEFSGAATAVREAFNDAQLNVTDDMETIAKVWAAVPPEVVAVVKEADEKLKDTIIFGDDKAREAAAKAAADALAEVKKLSDGVAEQVATFGMGEVAVVRYRVAHGELADTIAKAGEAAAPYVANLVSLTAQLQAMQYAEEASAQAQETLNEQFRAGAELTDSLKKPAEQYADTLVRLDQLLQQNTISQTTYDRAVAQAREKFADAQSKSNVFLEEAARNTQNIIADALVNGFEDGAKGMLRIFVDAIREMLAQALAAQLAKALFAQAGPDGTGAGLITTGLSAIAGVMDSGGHGQAGKSYLIGTGAQPEMFTPDRPGTFTPAGAGATNVTVNPQIINVRDPSEIPTALQSNAGEQAILNVISRNPNTIQNLLR